MSAATPVIPPAGPYEHELVRDRFETLTPAELVAVDFGPWPLAGLCDGPAEDWQSRPREAHITLGLAAELVHLDKAALVARMAEMQGAGLDEFHVALARWAHNHRIQLAMLDALLIRMVVGQAALEARSSTGMAADRGGAA